MAQGTMSLVWEGWAVAFPPCFPERFPWHPDADLATSVNGDVVWESSSPSLFSGGGWEGGRNHPLWPGKCPLIMYYRMVSRDFPSLPTPL